MKMVSKIAQTLLMLAIVTGSLAGQKFFTRTGEISFVSNAPLEKIEAQNKKATSVIDFETGQMEWAVLIKAFQFEKALMQEHFNENYMESSRYPKAIFKGKIVNIANVRWDRPGTYSLELEGEMEIRGVKKHINTTSTLEVSDKKMIGEATVVLMVADFNIDIPKLVRENIAKEVEIHIKADYQRLKS